MAPLFITAYQLVAKECATLDSADWDGWLALYAPEAQFWIPAWKDDETLTDDPQTQLSIMFQGSRSGLEDRVTRIRSGRSAATVPLGRTCHIFSLLDVQAGGDGGLAFHTNWHVDVYWQDGRRQTNFGSAHYKTRLEGDKQLIVFKKTVLLNDKVDTVLDIYSV
jgi:benzoate/toluate 1,2-dioxygenase beta subunit